MLVENILLPGVVYPTAGAAVALLLSLLFGQGGQSRRSGASLALGSAFAVGFVALVGWPRWPPVEATQRLAVAVSLLAAACFLLSAVRPPEGSRGKLSFASPRPGERSWPALLVFGLAWIAVSAALLENLLRHSWSTVVSVAWMTGLLFVGCAVWWVLRAHLIAQPEPQRVYPGERDRLTVIVLRISVLSGLAAVLGLAESALLGQLFGVVVCGVAVVDVGGWLLHRRFWRSSDLGTAAAMILGLLLISHHYAGLSTWPAVASVLALLLLPPAGSSLKRSLLPLLPLVAALTLLVWSKSQAPDDPYDYDYGALDTPFTAPVQLVDRTSADSLRAPGRAWAWPDGRPS